MYTVKYWVNRPNVILNHTEERSPQCNAAIAILQEKYGIKVLEDSELSVATTFGRNRGAKGSPVVFVPIRTTNAEPGQEVPISEDLLTVNGAEIVAYAQRQMGTPEFVGELCYVVYPESQSQPKLIELALLTYQEDPEEKAPSLLLVPYVIRFALLSDSGKNVRGYCESTQVDLRMVATKIPCFARLKINPHLQDIYQQIKNKWD